MIIIIIILLIFIKYLKDTNYFSWKNQTKSLCKSFFIF